MNKYVVLSFIRRVGLIQIADYVRFLVNYAVTFRSRRAFLKRNPGVVLPPAYYLYETFNLNYESFYLKSRDTAQWLVSHIAAFEQFDNRKILEWGCGPGRVIRHLPGILPSSCQFYGTDYNAKYIEWCRKNLKNITFFENGPEPPLPFPDNFFDIIYSISVFTHLSLKSHYSWFDELERVAKDGGILFFTVHGEVFKEKLTDSEKKLFERGELVTKAGTKEGHRTFAAFQPPSFIRQLVKDHQILAHHPGVKENGIPRQDVWIVRITKKSR